MSAFGRKLRLLSDNRYVHWCPGCKCAHRIQVQTIPDNKEQSWQFNNDPINPTFTPSIKIGDKCHYNIVDGLIIYHEECTHELMGKTVEMEDMQHVFRHF